MINQESTIIRTKLHPPTLSEIIHRERLNPLLSQFMNKRLVTVTAGAGYGKTTFISDAVDRLDLRAVWYRLDKSDRDFITFLYYLSAGVKKDYPEFGNEIFSVLNDPHGADRENAFLLTLFINDLERVCNEELFFVLDDFHLVQDSQEIKNALEFILNHLPDRIHLVILSRVAIHLPLSRLKGMREILDVDEKDLCFTNSEIKKIFFEVFKLSINEDHAKILYKKTNGWVSGLILFYHMLKGKSEIEIEQFLKNLRGSRGEIYTYLEENIFNQLSSDHQAFLIKTSILSRLNPNLCDQLLGITSSREILRYLKENHLFTFSLDEARGGYIYHDLLKEFLEEKLGTQKSKKEIRDLHRKTAILYEEEREYKTALEYYVKAGCMEDVSRMIKLFAWRWIRQGPVQQIRSLLKDIPKSYLKNDPWVLLLQAGLLGLSGQFREAISGYATILKTFRDQSSDDGLNICSAELAISYFNLGDYKKADHLFKELFYRKTTPTRLRLWCLGFNITLSTYLGKVADSDKYVEKAMSMLSEISEEDRDDSIHGWILTCIAWKSLVQGKLEDALLKAEKALEITQRLTNFRFFSLCNLIMSQAHFECGHYHRGINSAIEALDIVKEMGFKETLNQVGYLLLGYNSMGLGLTDDALRYANKSLEISRDIRNFNAQACAHILLYKIYFFHTGDLIAAEENVIEGMKAIENLELPLVQGGLELGLASIMTEKRRFNEVFELLQSAEKRIQHFEYEYAELFFQYACCYKQSGNRVKAIKAMIKGLSLCEINGYDSIPFLHKKWIMPLIVEVFAKGEKQDYIRDILAKIGLEAVNALSGIIENKSNRLIRNTATDLFNELYRDLAGGLTVQLFGAFRVFIGEDELPAQKFKSKKALQLFKYLVYNRHRGYLNKEILMELLWPEENPKKSSNNFHVALNAMRKVLEPDLPKSVPSAYILSDKGTYRIDIGNNGSVDVEAFSDEIKEAGNSTDPEASIDHYLKAISLYTGDFLEEDPYTDWCADVREQFKEEYLSAIKEVIRFYENQKAFDKCIDFASTYLKTDKYAEEIYQLLMRCYSHLGDNAMGIKTFEKCKETIMNDLNCPLSRETMELYQQLNPN